jgi:hypothetical protein
VASATILSQERSEVTLRSGQQALVVLNDSGRFELKAVTSISLKEQRELLDDIISNTGGGHADLYTVNSIRRDGGLPKSNLIRLTFLDMSRLGGAVQSLLVFENRAGKTVRYRADIYQGTEGEQSKVCPVLPDIPGVDSWPYEIDHLEISNLSLASHDESKATPCNMALLG